MSEYTVVDVEFKDEELLIKSLEKMGVHPEIHKEPVELATFYDTEVKPKAHIVVRKGDVVSFGDAGFERKENGSYQLHIDDMDQHRFKLGKIKQYYSEGMIEKEVKKRSQFSIKKRTENNGKIRIHIGTNF